MGKFITDRWVCAPQSRPGGIDSEPNVSLSTRLGRDAMAWTSSALRKDDDDGDDGGEEEDGSGGTMPDMTPGAKVAGAKTCFIV
jgi:hypothetical protein